MNVEEERTEGLDEVSLRQDGDVTEADRKKEQQDRLRRSALRSSVIQELREQYSDTPEEIRDRRDFQTERQSRDEQHRYGAGRTEGGHGPTARRLP